MTNRQPDTPAVGTVPPTADPSASPGPADRQVGDRPEGVPDGLLDRLLDRRPDDAVDCVVAGAGVVGLAIARALALAGREVVIAEAARAIGTGTSSRSSEVIHAGLYYPPGSRKARMCLAGRHALYAYCAARQVPHRRLGKLVVATSAAQHGDLEAIARRAAACGVDDLQPLSADQARALEPALRCTAALWSPSTGIVDSHALMLSLLADAESAGAVLALGSPVLGGAADVDGLRLAIGGEEPSTLRCRHFVNAAGHAAPRLARALRGLDTRTVPTARRCKGNYFVLANGGRAAFSRLIYPVPEAAGLGVHVTLDLAGQLRFGPDVEWLDDADDAPFDHRVDPARGKAFELAIRRYWPALPEGALAPAYAGMRPKISPPDAPAADFRIDGPDVHGVPGAVMLYGIESPGLTAALAIGDEVQRLLVDGG